MKKIWKRLLAAGLVIALVVTMVQVIPRLNTSDTAYAEGQMEYVTRGVVDSIQQLPQSKYGVNNYYNIQRGTAERPFVVLEIVPYEEYAEFGYLISGCEPVNVSYMHTNETYKGLVYGGQIKLYNNVTQYGNIYFFTDEPEGNTDLYYDFDVNNGYAKIPNYEIKIINDSNFKQEGYYELVKDGTGTFKYTITKSDQTATNILEEETNSVESTSSDSFIESEDCEKNENPSGSDQFNEIQSEENMTEDEPTNDSSFLNGNELDDEVEDKAEESDELSTQAASINAKSIQLISEVSAEDSEMSDENLFDEVQEELEEGNNEAEVGDLENTETDSEQNNDVAQDTEPEYQEDSESNNIEQDEDAGEAEDKSEILSQNVVPFTTVSGDDEPSEVVKVNIDKCEGGNLVWHSVHEFDVEYQKNFLEYNDETLQNNLLQNVGDRLYTYRYCEEGEEIIHLNKYFTYEPCDTFLKVSLGLDDDDVKDFCIVVKTITPEYLNNSPEWVDYADLILMSPSQHVEDYSKIWLGYHDKDLSGMHTEKGFDKEDLDISWNVALKIYNKVTADTNYAGIIIGQTLYDDKLMSKEKVSNANVYDYNLRLTNQKFDLDVSKNNVYKLCVMLFSMDSNLFKQLYLNDNNPLIVDGVFTLRQNEGKLANHWGFGTFNLINSSSSTGVWNYWNDKEQWNNYHAWGNPTQNDYHYWCNDHVFSYPDNNSMTIDFNNCSPWWHSDAYGQTFNDFYNSMSEAERQNISSPLAVRYILNSGKSGGNGSYGSGQTVRVLDLEPSVGLLSDGSPDWYLHESYVHMMLPRFSGKIVIDHQTTAEFIGKIDDLNCTYDLIYMGLDYSGYNTKYTSIQMGNNWVQGYWPDWNDDTRDGMIYMHTGDKIYNVDEKRSAKWLLDINQYKSNKTVKVIEDTLMRFAGNDISKLKLAELQDFLNADYPIVVEQYLYDLQPKLIDPASNIYAFVAQAKSEKQISETVKDDYYIDENGNTKKVDHFVPICSTTATSAVEIAMINKLVTNISIKPLFYDYDGTTKTTTYTDSEGKTKTLYSNEIANKHYLPRSGGYPYLSFEISTDIAGYKYKIYVDLDRNSRFTEDEIMNDTAVKEGTNVLKVGSNTYSQQLPSDWVGLLQYKVEVYSEANSSVRCSKVGYAAVQLKSNADRKEVKVLQIMPNAGTGYLGALDLETNETFIKYYKYLEDYAVTVKSITWDEFEAYFYYMDGNTPQSRNFRYDYTAEVKEGVNPVNLDKLQGAYGDLMSYNMFIIGFGDAYNGKTLSNKYGQIDFLQYFVNQGKSILFTHDLTSFYNVNTNAGGYTVNTLMRDLMGMNRYGAVNYQLEDTDRDRLIAFQNANYDIYDHVPVNEIHVYTYYAMKRMGYNNYTSNSNINNGYKMLYRYMITNAAGKSIGTGVADGQTTGLNGDGDLTTKTTKVNEGQITVYPYKINSELEIASTHGQYYQLSPEDPDVTVWYCLAGDSNVNAVKTSTGTNNTGTSMTYAASPNDAMNNYYIYSKGNVFYSGVGHSTVESDMEAMLFVNTMIAAYNAAYEPPKVVVTNDEAVAKGSLEYDIELLQSYDFNDKGELVGESFGADKYYTVTFKPQDYNLAKNTVLTGKIQWENGEYVTEIVSVSDGKVIYADSNNEFKNLQKDKVYSLQYPLNYLSKSWSRTEADGTVISGNSIQTIRFSIWNNRINTKNTTVLNISVQPLFPLD